MVNTADVKPKTRQMSNLIYKYIFLLEHKGRNGLSERDADQDGDNHLDKVPRNV